MGIILQNTNFPLFRFKQESLYLHLFLEMKSIKRHEINVDRNNWQTLFLEQKEKKLAETSNFTH